MRFWVSDLHFNHEKILEFSRPQYKSVDEMNKDIIRIWNEYIKHEDDVYILGDFCFKTGQKKGEALAIFHSLNGKKHLILGNHDNLKQIGDFGWASIQKEMYIEIRGVRFRMAHFPYPWGQTKRDIETRPECKTEPKYDEAGNLESLINGHVHEDWSTVKGCINVGWDIFHRPVSEEEIWKIYQDTNGLTEKLYRKF